MIFSDEEDQRRNNGSFSKCIIQNMQFRILYESKIRYNVKTASMYHSTILYVPFVLECRIYMRVCMVANHTVYMMMWI